jgi:molybdate transport system substrate-binding protein
VAVPCGLTAPLTEAIAAFEKANPDIKVEGTFDNAITNARHIIDSGKPPSLFISPGTREIGLLEEKGLVDTDTRTAFGNFKLVVVTPRDNPKDIHSLEDLKKADVISMPDPRFNSIGVYGKQALEKAGLWEALNPKGDEKFVLTEFPISAYEKISTGKADAALMFENCPLQTYPEKLKKGSVVIVAEVDPKLYEEPLCYIACLKGGPNPEDARKFVLFLTEPETQTLLADNGFKALDERAVKMRPKALTAPPAAEASTAMKPGDLKTPIKVEAFYPGNSDHEYLKQLVLELPKKYPGKVQAQFIDFLSDDGYRIWHDERKMSCGGIVINGEQVFLCEREGKPTEVAFIMSEKSGEWTRKDLYYVLDKATGKS